MHNSRLHEDDLRRPLPRDRLVHEVISKSRIYDASTAISGVPLVYNDDRSLPQPFLARSGCLTIGIGLTLHTCCAAELGALSVSIVVAAKYLLYQLRNQHIPHFRNRSHPN